MSHVLIDGYFLGKPYGFGRFIFELCRALGRVQGDCRITVAVRKSTPSQLLPAYKGLHWYCMPDTNFAVWEQLLVPRLARRLGCGVIHFPYNTRALSTRGARTVTTVHDLLFLDGPGSIANAKAYAANRYAAFVFRTSSVRSDVLVSVSDTTRALLAAGGCSSEVVHNTVDGFLEQARPATKGVGPPYLLHRGGYQPHRNTLRVIKAFGEAQRVFPDLVLKIIGAPDGAAVWRTAARDPAIQFLPRLSDSELASLYSGATAIVATSLHEGFGLPIIEGFGFDVPVITSDVDPMREIAGDAAILVEPHDAAAIAGAMTSIVGNPAQASALVSKGRSRLKDFSSAQVAEKMLNIYSRLLN